MSARDVLIAIITAVAALAVTACSAPVQSGDFVDIDASGWPYGRSVDVVINDVPDSVAVGNLAIALRHSADYEYSNIWLELSFTPSGDTVTVCDTLNIRLADVYGNWLGQGLGLSYQTIDTVARNVAIKENTPVRVRHIMRADRLSGIEQLGVIFIPNTGQKL